MTTAAPAAEPTTTGTVALATFVPPERPIRRPFLLPTTDLIFARCALENTQNDYEKAKANATLLETRKVALAEDREALKAELLCEIAKTSYASQAAQKRAEDYALANDTALKIIERHEAAIRLVMPEYNEDVSVFRHRMLSLRANLRTWGGEEED